MLFFFWAWNYYKSEASPSVSQANISLSVHLLKEFDSIHLSLILLAEI